MVTNTKNKSVRTYAAEVQMEVNYVGGLFWYGPYRDGPQYCMCNPGPYDYARET